jgi:hypothetical protein
MSSVGAFGLCRFTNAIACFHLCAANDSLAHPFITSGGSNEYRITNRTENSSICGVSLVLRTLRDFPPGKQSAASPFDRKLPSKRPLSVVCVAGVGEFSFAPRSRRERVCVEVVIGAIWVRIVRISLLFVLMPRPSPLRRYGQHFGRRGEK